MIICRYVGANLVGIYIYYYDAILSNCLTFINKDLFFLIIDEFNIENYVNYYVSVAALILYIYQRRSLN